MAAIFGTKSCSREASSKPLAIDKPIEKIDIVESLETESCVSQVAVTQPVLRKKKNKKRDLFIVEQESESTTTVKVDNTKPRENIPNDEGDDSVSMLVQWHVL